MKIKKRTMYAITDGQYKGDFLVFTTNKPINQYYEMISLPELTTLSIPEDDIKKGIELKILDYVERLSRSVYNELEKQIKIKSQMMFEEQLRISDEYNNRRQQFATQGVLDIEDSDD